MPKQSNSLTQAQLRAQVFDAILQSGWSPLLTSQGPRCPFDFTLTRNGEILRIRVYIWTLSHGGGPRNANEYRIQIHRDRFAVELGRQTLIVGWSAEDQVFGAFDVRKHLGVLGKSASMQIRKDVLERATTDDLEAQDKGNGETVLAFAPHLFVDYASQAAQLHDLGAANADWSLLGQTLSGARQNTSPVNVLELSTTERTIVVREVARKVRQSSFQKRVLTAYERSCAFCGIQLNLVDAAHIVPVAVDGSTDETSNGLSLCALHHRAFDNALVTLNSNYEVVTNEAKVDQLRRDSRIQGLDDFVKGLRKRIILAPNTSDRPNVNYVAQANKLRGWSRLGK